MGGEEGWLCQLGVYWVSNALACLKIFCGQLVPVASSLPVVSAQGQGVCTVFGVSYLTVTPGGRECVFIAL